MKVYANYVFLTGFHWRAPDGHASGCRDHAGPGALLPTSAEQSAEASLREKEREGWGGGVEL